MADKLVALRAEAKASMSNLVSKALLYDEQLIRHRNISARGYMGALALLVFPMMGVFINQMWEGGKLHQGFNVSFSFIVDGDRPVREYYRPEVYSREREVRPYENTQFNTHNW